MTISLVTLKSLPNDVRDSVPLNVRQSISAYLTIDSRFAIYKSGATDWCWQALKTEDQVLNDLSGHSRHTNTKTEACDRLTLLLKDLEYDNSLWKA